MKRLAEVPQQRPADGAGRRLAPISATEAGQRKWATAAAVATRSRSSNAAIASAPTSVASSTWSSPGRRARARRSRSRGRPGSCAWFSGSTTAVSGLMPARRARAATRRRAARCRARGPATRRRPRRRPRRCLGRSTPSIAWATMAPGAPATPRRRRRASGHGRRARRPSTSTAPEKNRNHSERADMRSEQRLERRLIAAVRSALMWTSRRRAARRRPRRASPQRPPATRAMSSADRTPTGLPRSSTTRCVMSARDHQRERVDTLSSDGTVAAGRGRDLACRRPAAGRRERRIEVRRLDGRPAHAAAPRRCTSRSLTTTQWTCSAARVRATSDERRVGSAADDAGVHHVADGDEIEAGGDGTSMGMPTTLRPGVARPHREDPPADRGKPRISAVGVADADVHGAGASLGG